MRVRGVNAFSSEVESTLLSVPGLAPHYQLLLRRPAALDERAIPRSDGKAVRVVDERVL